MAGPWPPRANARGVDARRGERLPEDVAQPGDIAEPATPYAAASVVFESPAARRTALHRRLVDQIWPRIPSDLLGEAITKQEREEILGYASDGESPSASSRPMIVDSSALLALIFREATADRIEEALVAAEGVAMGAPTFAETGMVLASKLGEDSRALLALLAAEIDLMIVPFTAAHAREARDAFLATGAAVIRRRSISAIA